MKRRTFLTRSLGLASAGLVAATLPGCGFHLRGLDLPTLGIDRLALSAPIGELTDIVRRQLINDGVTLTEEAPLRVNLGHERIEEFILTGGDSGSQEIELRLRVPFSVQRTSDNAYLLDQQLIEVTTFYQVSDSNLLVRSDLRKRALDELRNDAARQLLYRLRALDTP